MSPERPITAVSANAGEAKPYGPRLSNSRSRTGSASTGPRPCGRKIHGKQFRTDNRIQDQVGAKRIIREIAATRATAEYKYCGISELDAAGDIRLPRVAYYRRLRRREAEFFTGGSHHYVAGVAHVNRFYGGHGLQECHNRSASESEVRAARGATRIEIGGDRFSGLI